MTFLAPLPGTNRTDSGLRWRLPALKAIWPAAWLPLLVAGASGGAAFALTASDVGAFEPRLALLLRFMAALKAAAVLGAIGLTSWRLHRPVTPGTQFGYLAALAAMAAAPGLIWSLTHVAAGAVLFHAGLFGFLICALRDDALPLPRTRP